MGRPRRWRPRGSGFRRILDAGTTAVWMRREPDRTVTVVVYLDHGPDGGPYNGIWTVNSDWDGPILWQARNKPHRVRWAFDEQANDDGEYGRPVEWQPIPGGPPRRRPKTRSTWKHYRGVRRMPRTFGKEPRRG
ncbi:hypothetical protein [Nonomuraea bangladeshensis]|uniref:hypothetical protein n=1 Tax=Nonomuraea bangladeshensis TaxID=404385 RepID=UPI003C2C2DDD